MFNILFKLQKFIPGDNCQCGCKDNGDNSTCTNDLWYWNEPTCSCECPNSNTFDTTYCAISKSSPKAKYFNKNICSCECKTTKTCAGFQTYNGTTCDCDCIKPPETCPRGFSWNRLLCLCEKCGECRS